jgi:hypothetical protein
MPILKKKTKKNPELGAIEELRVLNEEAERDAPVREAEAVKLQGEVDDARDQAAAARDEAAKRREERKGREPREKGTD